MDKINNFRDTAMGLLGPDAKTMEDYTSTLVNNRKTLCELDFCGNIIIQWCVDFGKTAMDNYTVNQIVGLLPDGKVVSERSISQAVGMYLTVYFETCWLADHMHRIYHLAALVA